MRRLDESSCKQNILTIWKILYQILLSKNNAYTWVSNKYIWQRIKVIAIKEPHLEPIIMETAFTKGIHETVRLKKY